MSTSSSPEVATAAGAAKVPASPWSQPSRLLALAWGICALIVAFWYWIMKSLGTF